MELYKKAVMRFPLGSVSYMFAYGSGVKQQVGYDDAKKQSNNVIDFIFCVRDTLGFHAENIKRHPSHYSALHYLGPNFVRNYQEGVGANVYFNTLVPLADMGITIKYGVVSEDDLLEDLLDWRHLYLAGRLHKPVTNLVNPDDNIKLAEALDENRLAAFRTALLLLPETFNCYQLFHTIANLSYKGDFRMIFGENKKKVKNIVTPQQNDFFQLYKPAMRKLSKYVAVNMSGSDGSGQTVVMFEQDKSVSSTCTHLRCLPKELRKRLEHNAAFKGNYDEIVENLANQSNLREIVQVSVNDIVWRSSVTQSFKNIASAGILKSLVYSYRKAIKTFSA